MLLGCTGQSISSRDTVVLILLFKGTNKIPKSCIMTLVTKIKEYKFKQE